jgi:hypothetical protein
MNEEIYLKIRDLFSENGLTQGPFTFFADEKMRTSFNIEDDNVTIYFDDHKPEVTLKIVKAKIDGIKLGKNGGHIMLNNFPDVPFLYDWL